MQFSHIFAFDLRHANLYLRNLLFFFHDLEGHEESPYSLRRRLHAPAVAEIPMYFDRLYVTSQRTAANWGFFSSSTATRPPLSFALTPDEIFIHQRGRKHQLITWSAVIDDTYNFIFHKLESYTANRLYKENNRQAPRS